MRKQLLKKICMMVAAMAYGVFAVQPNFVETTTLKVDGTNDVKTTEYSDGLGRSIQTKLKLDVDTDRVSCTFYDEAGRPHYATKPFVDIINKGSYLPGEISDNGNIDNDVEQQLFNSQSDLRAFSETQYWDDPLGRVRAAIGPGDQAIYGTVKSWTLGVGLEAKPSLAVSSGGEPIGTVDFEDGMLKALSFSTTLAGLLDALYLQFLSNNPFFVDGTAAPTHFLTISIAPDNKISEELKDLFGRTVRTLSAPDTNGVTGLKIIASYNHDILGNVLTDTPPTDGGTKLIDGTEYLYNTLGQLIEKKTPDGGKYTYEYLDNGLLRLMKSWKDAATYDWGISYEYDDLGRTTVINEVLMGSAELPRICNYYDGVDKIPMSVFLSIPEDYFGRLTNLKGRLAATVTSNGVSNAVDVGELYSYDDEGRISRKFMVISGSPLFQETVYSYDQHGKVTDEKFYYSGDHIKKRYEYDKLGRLAKVYNCLPQPGGTYKDTELVAYDFNPVGQMNKKTFSRINGGITYDVNYGYDIRDRMVTAIVPAALKGYSESILYEKSGNIWSKQGTYIPDPGDLASIQVFNSHYDYDEVNRLKAATIENGTVTTMCAYDYDRAGRFKVKQEGASNLTGYSYYFDTSSATSRYTSRLKKTSKDPAEYIYDKRGNLVADFTKKMVVQYDWRDLPLAFRFYDDLSDAGITKDAAGTCTNTSLYNHMKSKVDDNTVVLVSTVMMVYDAAGNRVCKMDARE